jgi:2,4-dienoyl-CoA reductase (NADPH2)
LDGLDGQPADWKLLSPMQIGNREMPNRIMMPAMHLNYHRDLGFVDDTMVDFYRERAKGQAGLISIGGFAVERAGAAVFGGILWGIWDDEYIPDLKRLTKAMKAENSVGLIACQLYHTGRVSSSEITGTQPVGASDIPSRFNSEPVHALTTGEVQALEQTYIRAAERAASAGFDCIDVFCGVGHLLSQFLSPVTNNRTDDYGGSVANRARIVINIIRGIRDRLPGTPILARLAGHDLMPGGNTHEEACEIAVLLEAAGADAFNVTGGWHESRIPQITGEVPTGAYAWLAQTVRQAVTKPVAASNRINDPVYAERLLRDGYADFISMGRPLLADPMLPAKLMAGALDEITHCIACNICLDTAWFGPARCLVNPAAGREAEFAIVPAGEPKRVVVVGGGPGGMMAAKTLATRGHHVILYERQSNLGGVAAIGDVAPGKAQYTWLYEDLAKQVSSHPSIELRLGTTATADEVMGHGPDALIVATGGRPIQPTLPGLEESGILAVHAHEVLAGTAPEIGNQVVVVGGGSTACETALYLKEQGSLDAETVKFLLVQEIMDVEELRRAATIGQPQRHITVVQRSGRAAKDLNRSIRWTLLSAMQNAGIEIATNTSIRSVLPGEVIVEGEHGKTRSIPCDTLVIGVGIESETAFSDEIAATAPELSIFVIGDAASPRQATEALEEAVRAAMQI